MDDRDVTKVKDSEQQGSRNSSSNGESPATVEHPIPARNREAAVGSEKNRESTVAQRIDNEDERDSPTVRRVDDEGSEDGRGEGHALPEDIHRGPDEEASPDAAGPVPDSSAGVTPPTTRRGRSRVVTDVLIELEYASAEQVREAIEEARRTSGVSPEQLLLRSGAITADQLSRAVAERFGLDHINLDEFNVNFGAANLVSFDTAKRYRAVPVDFVDEGTLLLVMADPANVLAIDDLGIMTGHDIKPAVASPEDIEGLISQLSKLDSTIEEALEAEAEEAPSEITDIHEAAEDAPVIKLTHAIIARALESKASDIHFEPEANQMRIRYRVDGVLSEATTVPKRMVPGVISRVKVMADLDIAEHRIPQDGRVGLKIDKRRVDIRVVTLPSVHGEKAVMRLLDVEQSVVGLGALGLQGDALDTFERTINKPYGATFVTGPTGSGKTTTLYSGLNELNEAERSIFTIEDPVEYQIPGIAQIQVNPKAGLTFASGLRSMLRADPDVIMVGEIRDEETARIAIEAAMTGHLVLTTLHTNDAPSAITRMIEMGVEPFLVASAVDCIVAQRLARTLCHHCKRPVVLDAESLSASGFEVTEDVEGFEPVGCNRCSGIGFTGRIGIFEVMQVTDEIRQLTLDRASADQIAATARKQGMKTLRDDGLEKLRQGLTAAEEVTRVIS